MSKKITKAPGIFGKPVKKKKWDKKFLRKVYLPEDRKFLSSLAVEKDDMISVDADGLSKKDLKRLKAIGKAIKKNRKGLNFILIFILILLVAGSAFFHFYLKNKLVQRVVENQLENIFLAEVDTAGVNLSIFGGHFSMNLLVIANTEEPMTNLVEFTTVEADIDTAELLQGRVLIEELGFSGMRRGTPRTTSGKLKNDADTGKAAERVEAEDDPSSSGAVENMVGQISALAGNIDVAEIYEQQKENLKSFRLIEESKSSVEGWKTHWQGKTDEWSSRVDDWDASVKYIASVDADSFSDIAGAQSTITKLQSIYQSAETDYKRIQSDYQEAEEQYDEAAALMDEIRSAVDADYAYIESIVTLPAGDKVDWAASILEEQLSMPLKKYLSYLERGLEWYNRFKRYTDKKDAGKSEVRRPSRQLPVPADAPPAFTLVHAFASGEEPGLSYKFDLRNIVSEPDKWDGKASLDLGIDAPSTGAASAMITEDSLEVDVPAVPFDLGDSLSAVDIASFRGSLSVASAVGWDEGRFKGNVELGATDLQLKEAVSDSIVYRLISTSLESVNPLTAAGEFAWTEPDGLSLKLDTELDESLGDAAKALISEGAEEGLAMLKEYLGDQLAGPLDGFESEYGDLEGLVRGIKNYQTDIDGYKDMAKDKIAEIENSVKDKLKSEAENVIKDGASDALKNIGNKLNF
ncbi:MAG: hypothetical protein PQJ61_15275 [Spirochaetales bacterium]|uniref:TIGR03545 family protein n=1 Tax=Candidatus Thalassospirochaeta sargassi TaxID=3119039 RepID=A0AAJ1MPN3_9SPIO|nr:hypothetical protein [Spirochaetales bacterium]